MTTRDALAAVVVGHLLISVVHGAAHGGAHVPMSLAANLFVYIVIVAGPLIGLALVRRAQRLGGGIVAATMAASLLFGVMNHFVLGGSDHVSAIAARWRWLFATTAVLLAVTEAMGCALALRLVRERSLS